MRTRWVITLFILVLSIGCLGSEGVTSTTLATTTTITTTSTTTSSTTTSTTTTLICQEGETKHATCPDSVTTFLSENCVDGEWHTVMYIRNPCEPIPTLEPTPTSKPTFAPKIKWFETFGGPLGDFAGTTQQTQDGGYIIIGSKGHRTSQPNVWSKDIWLIKTDSKGETEWNKTYGGSSNDEGFYVDQTNDGGFITVGKSQGYVLLLKTDPNGEEEWNTTFAQTGFLNFPLSVQQTTDKGFIIAGFSAYHDTGNEISWIIKTDSIGNKDWDKIFNSSDRSERAHSVQQTLDEGYITVGFGPNGLWIVKTRSEGLTVWEKLFWGKYGYTVQQTSDEGYIIGGSKSGRAWLIKTDSNGKEEWNKTYAGSSARSVQQTKDGGYIFTNDGSVIKTNPMGKKEWNITIKDNLVKEFHLVGNSVSQTIDEGYVIGGTIGSGIGSDIFLIKLDSSN